MQDWHLVLYYVGYLLFYLFHHIISCPYRVNGNMSSACGTWGLYLYSFYIAILVGEFLCVLVEVKFILVHG